MDENFYRLPGGQWTKIFTASQAGNERRFLPPHRRAMDETKKKN
jgi:hypothetical protein